MVARSNIRITLASLAPLAPGDTLWDKAVKGFCARCRAGGTITYALKTRIKGRQRWITIGRHGAPWTPETARREALRILGHAVQGEDLGEQRQAERGEPTLAIVIDRFLAIHGPKLKPQTCLDYARIFNKTVIPKLGHLKISAITRAHCSQFHTNMAATPRKANLVLDILSRVMTWSQEHGYLSEDATNPTKGIKKFRETLRERYLSPDEYQRLGYVLDHLEGSRGESLFAIAALRLLILTGARLNEVLTLKWSYVDFERGVLRLPDSKTGAKLIRLNPRAIDVLSNLPRVKGNPYVIVGQRQGSWLVNLQKPWRRIRAMAGLPDVRIHDLRHSFASMAVSSGASLPMIGALLGHSQPRTTARYAHLADDPVRQTNAQVGDAISAAMGGDEPA
ncbi:MAG: tyrosine-type recombinase/integrase [Hyphomicrobiaceae bacterium]|nr:tyrosine-type recombinase/integrase [Hyphomicrobiaceae bacterium]